MKITGKIYAEYLAEAYQYIHDKGDYITELDSATGDGDHWSNMDMGFHRLAEMKFELADMPMDQLLKKVGMTMMSVIGGSSGVLYGGAYIAASKVVAGKNELSLAELCDVLNAMLTDIQERGKAKPGMKTMIDALAPAVERFKLGLVNKENIESIFSEIKQVAADGAEATKGMEAVKGRASYQKNKGVGHLDPGAVTMSYQIGVLCDVISKEIKAE